MSDALLLRDLSPYNQPLSADDDAWLARIAEIDPRDFRIRIGDTHDDDSEWLPIVQRGPDGKWWAGRFIGSLTVEGRQLVIEPRLGIDVVEAWLDQAFGLAAPPASARHVGTETFILRLMARLWCRSVDNATRHGVPLLRMSERHEGVYVRGKLDVGRTIQLIGSGHQAIASTTHARSLLHPATRAIVCADRSLADRLNSTAEWRTERVRQVLPHLRAAVGSRPRLPSPHELSGVRYTPITLPFKQLATLSRRIASGLGYNATDTSGRDEGLLVDVAELWELFVVNCARQAIPIGMAVEHGTRASRRDYLLRSVDYDKEIGRIKPDILITKADAVVVIIDAKYKRLRNTLERRYGIDQADLYQLAAYSMRFNPTGMAILGYPKTDDDGLATAALYGPWVRGDQTFAFEPLPTRAAACREALTALFASLANEDVPSAHSSD